MRRVAFPVILAHTLLFFGIPLAARERITVAAFEYPPIYQNGEHKGLSGDIVIAAFDAAGIDVTMEFLPVTRMVNAVADGEALCGIGGKILFSDPALADSIAISSIIQYVAQVFFYDTRKYPSLGESGIPSELKGYRIGVLNGSGIMRFLEKTKTLTLIPNTIHEGSAKQLAAGWIDAWAIVDLTGIMYLKGLYPDEFKYYAYTKPFNRGDVSVVFSKKADPDGRHEILFRQGLAAIKENGIYMKIMARYYGANSPINENVITDDMR